MERGSLGPYRIDRELGSGGMGTVYAATLTGSTPGLSAGSRVALKVVHPHLLDSPGIFKRFLREAQLGQSIRHDNVVRTLDCDQDFGGGKPQCFLVMEYVEGQTLSELLRELERVPEDLCRHVAREICKGLAAVHGAGVVHRDLKPENVIVAERPTSRASRVGGPREGSVRGDVEYVVKIMDLGVAQVADEALRLSRDGAFVGSVEYAAPEQFKGGEVDGRTDLHALGVLLYELSTGHHPYRGGGFHQAMQRVCEAEPRRLGEINPQLSAFFEEVVHTLLVKDPRGRFASATQLLDALELGEDSAWWHQRARSLQAKTRRPIRRIRIPRETGVYGRDAELATLHELFLRAKAGDGEVVLIEGEAGIGKSRLVDEFVAQLHAKGENLNFLFGSYPPGGAATASGAFSEAFRDHLGEAGAAAYLSSAPQLAPSFDALLRGDVAPPDAQRLTQQSLITCFRGVTRGLAEERPTVVLIDDLHFAPDDARALFAALAAGVEGQRVLLVGTTRPGLPEEWRAGLTRLDHTTSIELQRLGPKDLVRLLTDSFGSAQLAERLGGTIAAKSDGNPFFAFEIVRGLRDGQFLTRNEDGTWAATRVIDDIQIPSSVLDLVNARVAGLSEDDRALLDVAACWGYEFDPSLIGEVLGLARIPTLRAFGQIERLHRLVRSSGRRYVFDHHQVQEALYGSMNEQLREEYHSALAEALEMRTGAAEQEPESLDGALCVDLCEQYLKGGRGERALPYLEAARLHLAAGHVHGRAVALTERALAAPGLITGAERAKTLSILAQANGPLDQLGQRAKQLEYATQAEQMALEHRDPVQAGWAANAGAWVLVHLHRHDEARGACDRALECARTHGVERLEAVATGTLGQTHHATGRQEEAIACYRRAASLWRRRGDAGSEAGTIINIGKAYFASGRLSEALEELQRGLELAREAGERRYESSAAGNLGNTCFAMGRFEDARAWFERSLALARENGDVSAEGSVFQGLGNVFLRLDRLEESAAAYERQRVVCRELGDRVGEASARGSLAAVLRRRGRAAEAREQMEAQIDVLHGLGDRMGEAVGLHNLGLLDSAEGDLDGAHQKLRACLSICDEIGQRHLATATHLALGTILADDGRRSGADGTAGKDDLIAARDLARANGYAGYEALACCGLARLPGGDATEAAAAVAAAAQVLSESELRSAHYTLWKVTGATTHLLEAKRLLDEALARASEDERTVLLDQGSHREVLAAAIGLEGDDDEPATESVTRAG